MKTAHRPERSGKPSARRDAGIGLAVWVLLTPGIRAIAADVVVARDGKPLAAIVLGANPHALEKEAAEDLQWAIRETTGATLPVGPTPPPAGLIPIRIGSAAAGDRAEATEAYDAAVVRTSAEGLDVFGPTAAGTANAVATILLEDLGIRQYYPERLFAIAPKAPEARIRPRRVQPTFQYRLWSGVTGRDAGAYIRRNRLTDTRVPIPRWGFGHNLATIISVEAYGKSHPEYFPLRDGKRLVQGRNAGDTPQPCFTHPDVVRLSIEAARRFFDTHPSQDTFSLCVNDNSRYCECPACAVLDAPYRDIPVGRQYAESYYDYVAKVAEAIAQSHPGRFLGVYAYWNVEQPPRNRARLPDNVIVALTLDILQHCDPAYRDKDRALLRAWADRVRHLHTYVYYGLGWYTPRTSPRLVAEDLRYASQNRVEAIYCEAYPFWAWCGPMHYVAARLQWDAGADAERILDEFHRDCFDDVAADMRACHDACERFWTRPRQARWFEGLDKLAPEEAMADLPTLREAERRLEAALAKTRIPLVRERIAWLRKGFAFTSAVADAFEAKQRATGADRLERLLASAQAVETAHAAIAAEPAYVHAYYEPGDRFTGKCWQWFKEPLRAAAEARWREIHKDAPPADADARWNDLAKTSGLSSWLERRKWDFRFER